MRMLSIYKKGKIRIKKKGKKILFFLYAARERGKGFQNFFIFFS
jgi:hypothetical protein